MKQISTILFIAYSLLSLQLMAQVGVNTDTPDASAALEVSSTDKGFLPPRMTEAQREAITSPANGLVVFQTDGRSGLYTYDGGAWKELSNRHITNFQLYSTDADWGSGYVYTSADNQKVIPFSDVFVDGTWFEPDGKIQAKFVVKVINRTGNSNWIYVFKDQAECMWVELTANVVQSEWFDFTITGLSTFDIRVGNGVGGGTLENAQLLIRAQ